MYCLQFQAKNFITCIEEHVCYMYHIFAGKKKPLLAPSVSTVHQNSYNKNQRDAQFLRFI